jgi:drug/metabolite transporter (DMT)-like permease
VALGSVGPVYGLILDWPFKGQIPTITGLVGVFLTVVGVVILCFWGT